ncbi:hypothetical protein EFA69_15985 [Rufibacter immobilis]|uniref:Uncharacterized protein n=1 Tax=Rufibacter immobilis TaxID=1348778 RepID=A0A3M9MSC5_9BACT|nr:hypothetical protein EFA69_15985 [Rufibacter immobilis]
MQRLATATVRIVPFTRQPIPINPYGIFVFPLFLEKEALNRNARLANGTSLKVPLARRAFLFMIG